jgi:hypothetical protein
MKFSKRFTFIYYGIETNFAKALFRVLVMGIKLKYEHCGKWGQT